VSIGTSYSIPVATGTGDAASLAQLDNAVIRNPAKRYVITVLPDQPPDGPSYTMSAAKLAAGQNSATVKVLSHPVPTAQISVLVFMDNAFINGAPDIPAEAGLPGFKILLFDQVGQMGQDAFANPLGTTYLLTCDANGQNPGTGTGYCVEPDGSFTIETLGNGIFTDDTGNVIIKNLYPGKYGIRAVPTDNQLWVQTSTIEGTPGIDTWVTANEPPQFIEGGFFNVHAFIGFVHPSNDPQTGLPLDYGPKFLSPGGATVKGRVVSVHGNRPPLQPGLELGRPVVNAWVGLSDTLNGNAAVFSGPCNDNSEFTITGVPPGTYTLTMWDFPLDQIIDYRTVVVTADNSANNQVLDFGDIPLFRWFGWFSGYVFADANRNGFRTGTPQRGIGWRRGSKARPSPSGSATARCTSTRRPTRRGITNSPRSSPGTNGSSSSGAPPTPGSGPGRRCGSTTGEVPVQCRSARSRQLRGPLHLVQRHPDPAAAARKRGKGVPHRVGGRQHESHVQLHGGHELGRLGKDRLRSRRERRDFGNVFYQAMRTEVNPAQAGQTWWATGIPRVKLNLYEDMNRDGIPDGPIIQSTFTKGWDDNFPTGCVDNVGRAQPFSSLHRLRGDHLDVGAGSSRRLRRDLLLQEPAERDVHRGGDPAAHLRDRQGGGPRTSISPRRR